MGCFAMQCRFDSRYKCGQYMVIKTTIFPKPFSTCLSCEIMAYAKQSIFLDKGGGMVLSIESRLAQKIESAPEYISITDTPDTLLLRLRESKFKTDSRGNEALFLYLNDKDGKTLVQKYTQTTYNDILEAINNAGGSEYLTKNFVSWTKQMVGRMQNPRFVPEKLKKVASK